MTEQAPFFRDPRDYGAWRLLQHGLHVVAWTKRRTRFPGSRWRLGLDQGIDVDVAILAQEDYDAVVGQKTRLGSGVTLIELDEESDTRAIRFHDGLLIRIAAKVVGHIA